MIENVLTLAVAPVLAVILRTFLITVVAVKTLAWMGVTL